MLREGSPMFAGLRKLLGSVLYWIGWGVAVIVIAQAIILSITSGNPGLPVLFGGIGVFIWLIGCGFKYMLTRPKGSRSQQQ
jgi:hypothetical protein